MSRLPARLLLVRMLETALPVRVHLLQAGPLLPEMRMLLCILVRIRMRGIPIR